MKARNSVGYSQLSAATSILAAQVPDTPSAPTTSIKDRWTVEIEWQAPYNGGSSITAYTVELRTIVPDIWSVAGDCDGS